MASFFEQIFATFHLPCIANRTRYLTSKENQVSRPRAKWDFLRNTPLNLMNRRGTGNNKHDTPPSRLAAGPTPKFSNMGRAATGIAHARTERRIVLADTALAA